MAETISKMDLFIKPGHEEVFDNIDSFQEHLAKMDRNTIWQEIKPENISFVEGSDGKLVFIDNSTHTSESFNVLATSKKSILDRCRISGQGLESLETDKYIQVLNWSLQTNPNDCFNVIKVDNQVAAILSGGDTGNNYAKINALDSFNSVMDMIEMNGLTKDKGNFRSYYDNFGYKAYIEVEKNVEIGGEEYGVTLEVSDNSIGLGCFALGARFNQKKSGDFLPGVYPQVVKHRGGSDYSDIQEALDMVLAAIDERARQLDRLKGVHLDFSKNALISVAKSVGLPRKHTLNYVNTNRAELDQPLPALNVCLQAGRIVDSFEGSMKRTKEYELAYYKACGADWKKHDTPKEPETNVKSWK